LASICFVLTKSPLQSRFGETVNRLSLALLNAGHTVSVFLFLDGVFSAVPALNHPGDRFEELLEKGVRFMACKTSARQRGLLDAASFIRGVKIAGLSDLADLLGGTDRLITF
jgi:sulfur relay (sulfurtransferase) complex TusBCD TusD component (DsrE family)